MEKDEKSEGQLSFWIYGGKIILDMKKYCDNKKLNERAIKDEAMSVEYYTEYSGEKDVFKIRHQIGNNGILWEEYIGADCKFKTIPGQEGWERTLKKNDEYQMCLEARDAVLTGYSARKIWFFSAEFLKNCEQVAGRIDIYSLSAEEALKDSSLIPIGFEFKEYKEDQITSVLDVRIKRVVLDWASLSLLDPDLKRAITGTNTSIEKINDCFYHWPALLVLKNRENNRKKYMGEDYIVVQSIEELFEKYEDMRREIEIISIKESMLALKNAG